MAQTILRTRVTRNAPRDFATCDPQALPQMIDDAIDQQAIDAQRLRDRRSWRATQVLAPLFVIALTVALVAPERYAYVTALACLIAGASLYASIALPLGRELARIL